MASPTARTRLSYAPDLVAAVYAIVYFAWLGLRTPGTATTDVIGTVAFLPLGLAGTWAAWQTSRAAGLDSRTRRFWRLCAASFLALWVTGNTWVLLILFNPQSASREFTDWLTTLHVVILVTACLALPRPGILPAHRRRFFLDVGLVTVAGFVLVFYFELRTYFRPSLVVSVPYALVATLLDWVSFVTAVAVYMRSSVRVNRVFLGLIVAANTVWLFANSVITQAATYRVGDWVDGAYFLAWVLRIAAARVAWHAYRLHGVATVNDVVEYRSSLFPHLLVSGAFFMLLALVVTGDTEHLGVLTASAAVMTASLLARQMAEIAENRRLFAAQLAQEQRFRSLVQHSSDLVMVVNEQRRVQYLSPAAASVLGSGIDLKEGVALGDAARGEDESFVRLITPGSPLPDRVQCRVRAADGGWRRLEIAARDLHDDPAVGGIVLNCRDVTERSELEQQLRRAQKLEAIGHLAGGLAHDFNNVLAVIRGYAELLKLDVPASSDAGQLLGHLDHAVDRAAAVTKKLLAFGRRQSVRPAVIDLGRVLTDLQPMLRQLLPSGTEATVECAADLWHLKADPGQVEQVVLNLAANGRDAMPSGGRLTVSAFNRRLGADVPPLPAGDYVVLRVTDEGVGISPEVQARMFEPFFTTKSPDQGSGLGLAMVYGIVTEAGGHIRVQSAPGEGTRFDVLWPRTRDAIVEAPSEVPHPGSTGEAASILLVEDEPGVRSFASRLLTRAGYLVTAVASGEEALAHLEGRTERVDLLVTDLVMPGMHGRTLIERVNRLRPGVPVVCMTGYAGGDPDEPDLSQRVAAILDKPFRAETLMHAVARALRLEPSATPAPPPATPRGV